MADFNVFDGGKIMGGKDRCDSLEKLMGCSSTHSFTCLPCGLNTCIHSPLPLPQLHSWCNSSPTLFTHLPMMQFLGLKLFFLRARGEWSLKVGLNLLPSFFFLYIFIFCYPFFSPKTFQTLFLYSPKKRQTIVKSMVKLFFLGGRRTSVAKFIG